MSEPRIIQKNWKREFQDGEVIAIKGMEFIIVAVTKRGLTFRKYNGTSKHSRETKLD